MKDENAYPSREAVPFCEIRDGHIVLQIRSPELGPEYKIWLEGCDSPEKILGWIVHLSEKTWMTPKRIQQFLLMACRHHGIDPTKGT